MAGVFTAGRRAKGNCGMGGLGSGSRLRSSAGAAAFCFSDGFWGLANGDAFGSSTLVLATTRKGFPDPGVDPRWQKPELQVQLR
jgi:hypothetical protein